MSVGRRHLLSLDKVVLMHLNSTKECNKKAVAPPFHSTLLPLLTYVIDRTIVTAQQQERPSSIIACDRNNILNLVQIERQK